MAVASSSSVPAKEPRVGVAAFVVDDRGFVLVGKRKGSHGSGTLALPGGHLEWQESWEDCIVREVKEETGISIDRSASSFDDNENTRRQRPATAFSASSQANRAVSFLTAVNATHIDASDNDDGKHYVTIFMKARVYRSAGQDEIPPQVMEPNKCDGWVWVPLNYLYSLAEAQESLQRMASSSAEQGDTLGVPLEKLLLAQRLGERIHQEEQIGSNSTDAHPTQRSAAAAGSGTYAHALEPRTDDERIAWALADDLADGAKLFKPLMDVLREQEEVLRAQLVPLSRRQPVSDSPLRQQLGSPTDDRSTAGTGIQLGSGIFDAEATQVINEALAAPPHLKHSTVLTFPTPTPEHAKHIVAVLSVDRPLRPHDTSIKYETLGAQSGTPGVRVTLLASTVRLLRLSSNAICEDVSLVVKTMQSFPGPSKGGSTDGGSSSLPPSQPAVTFEEGTIGKVEQT